MQKSNQVSKTIEIDISPPKCNLGTEDKHISCQ